MWPAILGVGVILVSFVLLRVNPATAGALSPGFRTPIIALEFAESEAEIEALFGKDAAQRTALMKAFDRGNWIDFGYMALYAGFLATFSLALRWVTKRPFFIIPAMLSGVIFLADLLENVQLLGIMTRLNTGDYAAQLWWLGIFTWLKWGMLAVVFLLFVPYFWRGSVWQKGVAATAVGTAILAVSAFLNRGAVTELFATAVALMFVWLIVYAWLMVLKWER